MLENLIVLSMHSSIAFCLFERPTIPNLLRTFVTLCACAFVDQAAYFDLRCLPHTYIYIYIYICVCVMDVYVLCALVV